MTAAERQTFWKTRLQPFKPIVVSIWTILSLQKSLTASFGTYATVFLLLLGSSMLDGTVVHQLGVFLLFTALCYALLVAGLKFGSFESLTCDQEAVLQDVCVHLAELECLVVGLVGGVMEVRAQKPLAFYVGGILLVFVLGRLGVWLTFHTLLWISVAILLAMPAALCKGWISKQTLDRVRETTSSTATAVHTYVFSHT